MSIEVPLGTEDQVVSKKRVEDHGEVYTAKREVDAMLDLTQQEVTRIESRILEPACGNGNFLAEVLSRKLKVIADRYSKSQIEYERYSIITVGSLYGLDILADNVSACRARLLDIFSEAYKRLFRSAIKNECLESIKYILSKNIIWGDALTLQALPTNEPIVFAEWSSAHEGMIKRRDYCFKGLIQHAEISGLPLFSDLGEEVFIPTPVKEHPVTGYFKIANVQ